MIFALKIEREKFEIRKGAKIDRRGWKTLRWLKKNFADFQNIFYLCERMKESRICDNRLNTSRAASKKDAEILCFFTIGGY
jgi:hypothetical protein